MKIKKLHIKNFKSLVDVEIVEPNPFTVFVGANGVGKSNIFEALEFGSSSISFPGQFFRMFGNEDDLLSKQTSETKIEIILTIDPVGSFNLDFDFGTVPKMRVGLGEDHDFSNREHNNIDNFWLSAFSRIFIGNRKELKLIYKDDLNISLDGSNVEKVLKRILLDIEKREELIGNLKLFIPEFENLEIHSDEISGNDTLLLYESSFGKPFSKNLISDGTYNILCLLTAIFQSDRPQFLCIEEPENGLTPDVIKELVKLFRNACEEKGHYIWLNTHSQSLVSQLTADELITVDKINGETRVKQFKGKDFHGLSMDEAWLTNTLGAGLPW